MQKKIILGLITCFALATTALAAPPTMVLNAFEKGFKERMAAQAQVAPLPDGLHVILTGTGSPLNDPLSAASGVVINAGGKIFVIDAGSGSARKMQTVGIPTGRIQGLLLTHFHSDHIADLGDLAMSRWTGSAAQTPLTVYGPEGVTKVVEGFNLAYSQDNDYRIAHHGEAIVPASGKGSVAKEIALGDDPMASQVIYEEDGLKITMFNVDHSPVKPAVGYRFDYKGRSAVISGDTIVTEGLAKQTQGVDLLVQDVLSQDIVGIMAKNMPVPNTKKILSDIPTYHADPVSVGDMAQKSGVKNLVFTHIVPPMPDQLKEFAVKAEAAKSYKGNIVLGKDGLRISLPADKDTVELVEMIK